jgi:hypothetical protein
MSKKSQEPQQSEEVDLGQLFKLIGNAFSNLFAFIGGLFYKIFLGFVWLIFFIKKHFIKLAAAGIIGVILGFTQEKTSQPTFKSYITIKQNYNIGESLYNSISYYNDLIENKDYDAIERTLDIDSVESASILGFEVESVLSENERIKEYDVYIKTLDSTVAATVNYELFLKNDKDYKHPIQQISIKSKNRNNFQLVFDNIIKNIKSNEHFVREQFKDLKELTARKQSIEEALVKSDSLQVTYKKVLENILKENSKSEIEITFEGSNQIDKTKEFELYKSDLELRSELVDISREIDDKEHLLEIISSKQDSGVVDNGFNILGLKLGLKLFYGIFFTFVVFIILLCLKAIKALERYKSEI